MKRLLPLAAALIIAAGCSQPDEATTAANQAAPAVEPAATQAPAGTTTPPTAQASTNQASAPDPAAAANAVEPVVVDLSSVEAAGFVAGQHYRRLTPAQPTNSAPGTVEVAEFFMHSCIHCYNLEPFVEAWLEEKPDHIEFVRVPTTWDAFRQLHAQAYYTAEALGVVDEIMMPFFQEIHLSGNLLETPGKLAALFESVGVSRDEFDGVFESFAVMTRVNRATELGRRYRVDSTPTIVINGKYTTGTSMADPVSGNPERLFELIEALAAAELGL